MKYVVNGYIPFSIPDDGPEDDDRPFYSAIEELLHLSQKVTLPFGPVMTQANFSIVESSNALKLLPELRQVRYPTTEIIAITIALDTDESAWSVSYGFQKRIFDILNILCLAKPGWFWFQQGLITVEDCDGKTLQRDETPMWFNYFHFAVMESKRVRWPTFSNIEIDRVWAWYLKHLSSTDSMSGTPVGRALNALSYLFHDTLLGANSEELFWALLGIEALYGTGSASIQTLLDQKTQLVLGHRKEFKKKFSQMYNFRSRFVHGGLDFPNNVTFEETDRYEDYFKEIGEIKGLAVAILLATLQAMIKNNWNSLEFNLSLSGNSSI